MATAWRSKWLDWTPEQAENISDTPQNEVPKVPKLTAVRPETTFGTFGTDFSRASENISCPSMAEWDAIFASWTKANCRWRERSYGSTSRLYVDCCEWSHAHSYPLVPDVQAFETILACLGFDIRDGLVYGLLMREDACLTDSAVPESDFNRLTLPEAAALDNLYVLPKRKPRTSERKHYGNR